MKLQRNLERTVALTAAAAIGASCGNDKADDKAPTGTAGTGGIGEVVEGQVGITGAQALSLSLTNAPAPTKVLAFPFLGSDGFGTPKETVG